MAEILRTPEKQPQTSSSSSNSAMAIFAKYFSADELKALEQLIAQGHPPEEALKILEDWYKSSRITRAVEQARAAILSANPGSITPPTDRIRKA